jgi:hypothetical protein
VGGINWFFRPTNTNLYSAIGLRRAALTDESGQLDADLADFRVYDRLLSQIEIDDILALTSA